MPGAFHYDGPSNDAAPISGVHPGLFRQPVSPSPSTSVYLGSSLYSDASTSLASNVKRKRQAGRESTPLNEWTIADDLGTSMTSSAGGRKPDLGTRKISGGRRKYILAGQINTPTAGSGNNGAEQRDGGDCMEDSVYSDIDYRRALGSKRPHADIDATPSSAIPETPKQAGWSTFALQTIGGVVGGVVGKVWEFCKAGAFRGFYAGGGKGYDMPAPAPTATISPTVPMPTTNTTRNSGQGQIWCNEHDVPTYPVVASGPPAPILSTPYYYEREVPIESVPTSFSHAPQQPAAKRRQINGGLGGMQGRDELRRNWVVVNNDENNNNSSNNNNNNKRPSAFTSRAPVMVRSYYKDPPRPPPRNNLFNRNYGPNRAGASHGLNNTTHAFGVASRPSTPKLSNASMAGSSGGTSPTPREPASYASPRSSPVAPTPTLAPVHTAPSPVPAPQLSPSRIPVPVAPGGSRPHSPATRIASPSPSPSPHPHPSSSAAARRRLGNSAHGPPRRRSQGIAGSGRPGSAAGGGVRRRESSVSDLGGHGHGHNNSSKARLDREAQKLAARRLQAEREADLRITDFNARLREMIRQGREALGTSVEVDVLGGGDGGGGGGDIWEDD